MNDRPRLADRLAVLTGGGLKRLGHVTRSAVVLLCLCLLGSAILTTLQGLFYAYGDETALRVILVFLADLNGDEHQDAFLVTNQMHRIVFNAGNGNFTSSRELFMQNYALALGDLDGDGGLDSILINSEAGEMKLECADTPSDAVFPAGSEASPNQVFAIRDGNGDGKPESFIAGCCGSGTIMVNYATFFSNRRSCLESENPRTVALGDLNGDDTLDVFLVKPWTRQARTTPNEVWFNDGQGNFADSGQRLGHAESYAVALGDLNGDGFLDAVVGNRGAGEIWLNDGQGNFSLSKQHLGRGINTIFVSDLDGDGDLDLFLGSASMRVWLNDGAGQFKAGQRIDLDRYEALTIGDLTGDGIPDVFVGGPTSYLVWLGEGDGRFSAYSRSSYR